MYRIVDVRCQPKIYTHLVGIFYEHIFSFRKLQTKIRDCTNDTPAIRKRNIELHGEIGWACGSRRKYHMASTVPRIYTGNIAIEMRRSFEHEAEWICYS